MSGMRNFAQIVGISIDQTLLNGFYFKICIVFIFLLWVSLVTIIFVYVHM